MEKLLPEEEQKLWHAIQHQADERAFRRLFDHYYQYLRVTAYRYLLDEGRANDIVQDVFVDFWGRRQELTIQQLPSAYLRRMVVNRSLNAIKRAQRMSHQSKEDMEMILAPARDVTHHLEQEETIASLHAAIDALPPRCRTVFLLSRFEDLSHKEIASQLDISTKTIENQITKALKILSQTLKTLCGWLL